MLLAPVLLDAEAAASGLYMHKGAYVLVEGESGALFAIMSQLAYDNTVGQKTFRGGWFVIFCLHFLPRFSLEVSYLNTNQS